MGGILAAIWQAAVRRPPVRGGLRPVDMRKVPALFGLQILARCGAPWEMRRGKILPLTNWEEIRKGPHRERSDWGIPSEPPIRAVHFIQGPQSNRERRSGAGIGSNASRWHRAFSLPDIAVTRASF